MRSPLLILALLTLACSPQARVVCVTSCGVAVASADDVRWPCEEFDSIEQAALDDGALPRGACETWRGITAWPLPGDTTQWHLPDGGTFDVAGWAECFERRVIFHEGDEWRRLWNTAYVHELTHIAQGCSAPLPVDDGADVLHANWFRAGLFDLTSRVGARLEFH